MMIAATTTVACAVDMDASAASAEVVSTGSAALAAPPVLQTFDMEPVAVAAAAKMTFVGGIRATPSGRAMRVERRGLATGKVRSWQWGAPGDNWLDALDADPTGFAIAGRTAGPVRFGDLVDYTDTVIPLL
ncbi:MAG: hypothetical protein AAGC55_32455, partial [Myxococcota bacterium]